MRHVGHCVVDDFGQAIRIHKAEETTLLRLKINFVGTDFRWIGICERAKVVAPRAISADHYCEGRSLDNAELLRGLELA